MSRSRRCARTWRQGVIAKPTNCYGQKYFKSIDQAFTYCIGLRAVLHEQFKVEPDENQANTSASRGVVSRGRKMS